MTEQELRRQYLAKLNRVVELSIEILKGNWASQAATVNQAREELIALGEITSLTDAAVVARVGWYVGDQGNRSVLEAVSNALIHLAEHYHAGAPIVERDLLVADWRIDKLEKLLRSRRGVL
jgi:hypothetical protein